jgi:hypothetical protein
MQELTVLTEEAKYSIGELVSGGVVVGIYHPDTFISLYADRFRISSEESIERLNISEWGKTDWKNQYIYIVNLDNPTRHQTYEQFLNCIANTNWYTEEGLRNIYEQTVKLCLNFEIPEGLLHK